MGATVDIILIQEANITDPQFAITNPGFTLIIPPCGDQPSNRTAAYITRSNLYLRVTQRTDICDDPDLQVLEVGTDVIPSFFLLNIYNQRDPQTKIYTIPRTIAPLPLPRICVITGDLNAHHGLWNSLVQEPKRADELVTLIENRDWVLVSVPDEARYHFKNGKGSSVLDLTLASPEVINWAIDTDQATGSDHEVIPFQVISTLTPRPPLRNRTSIGGKPTGPTSPAPSAPYLWKPNANGPNTGQSPPPHTLTPGPNSSGTSFDKPLQFPLLPSTSRHSRRDGGPRKSPRRGRR
jgi:hypothetical protein